ncbi:MAG: carbohydrate kinase family protein [Pseudomonadales bacterium]|jgi:sugar/nucleoside kinase (ribokinase family)|nr:carbohydrate kinase family protein [Pseudomonadales bacterium]
MKITTIGSGMIDIFIRSSDFSVRGKGRDVILQQAFGAKIEVDECEITTGGGATNTAVGFARHGFKVSCLIETGKDVFAKQIKDNLQAEGVSIEKVISEVNERTGFSIVLVDDNGERTIMINRGASAMLTAKDIDVDYLRTKNHLHLSSVGGKKSALSGIWKACSGDKAPTLSWNPGQAELNLLRDGELSLPNIRGGIFIVNYEEWQMIAHLAKAIAERFFVIAVTDGKRGGQVFAAGQKPLSFSAANVKKIVDVTGAGDAFCSGLVSGILGKQTLTQAVKMGVDNAGGVISHLGGKKGLLYKK